MFGLSALLLSAATAPAVEPPRGVTALGSVRAEIVQAERASQVAADASRQHLVRREGERITVYFN